MGRPSWLDDLDDPTSKAAAKTSEGVGEREKPEESAADEEEEEDYMSDAFLASLTSGTETREQTFSQRRKRPQAGKGKEEKAPRIIPTGTWKEREDAARQRGLSRNLLAGLDAGGKTQRDEEGDSKAQSGLQDQEQTSERRAPSSAAVRMMLAMGYKHGTALGAAQSGGHAGSSTTATAEESRAPRSPSPEDAEDPSSKPPRKRARFSPSGAHSPSDGSIPAPSAAPLTTPLPMDTTRADRKTSRMGLGHPSIQASKLVSDRILDASRLASARADSAAAGDHQDVDAALSRFRSQTANAAAERRVLGHLGRARRTAHEMDARSEMSWSTLWVDVAWCGHDAALPAAMVEVVRRELGVRGAEGRGELQRALIGDVVERQRERGVFEADEAEVGGEEGLDKVHAARREELRMFCALDAPTRLDLTLTHLRSFHHYCLFCGALYTDQQDLEQHCPGETEDDHD